MLPAGIGKRGRARVSKLMASDSYDVLILGGGNAGFGVTVPTRKAGDDGGDGRGTRDLGGTCPNRGCTPEKSWWPPATRCTRSSKLHVHHIQREQAETRLGVLIDREKR